MSLTTSRLWDSTTALLIIIYSARYYIFKMFLKGLPQNILQVNFNGIEMLNIFCVFLGVCGAEPDRAVVLPLWIHRQAVQILWH